MLISSLKIDGRNVVSLLIDGRNVPIGRATPDYFYVSGKVAAKGFRPTKVDVTFTSTGSAPDFQFEYSTDGTTWTTGSIGTAMTISNTATTIKPFNIFIRAPQGVTNSGTAVSSSGYLSLSITGNTIGDVFVGGNIMTLIDGTGKTVVLPGNYTFANLFKDCTTLTDASGLVLPAETMTTGCYSGLFYGCSSLTQAPELPATTLAASCYASMFHDCTSLTQAPALPATTLVDGCYVSMFNNCSSLTQAPALPATTLAANCYVLMFHDCSSLTQAPEKLPATTLATNCYASMFLGCTSLTQASELPATELVNGCYTGMFRNCTSLTQAPELPATELVNGCYNSMFYGCTSLNNIKVAFTNWDIATATGTWLPNNIGTFECTQELINNTSTRTTSTVPSAWTMVAYDVESECLCFTAEESGSTVKLSKVGAAPDVNLQTSTDDGGSWTPYTVEDTITLANVGDKVYFKAIGSNLKMGSSNLIYNNFVMTGKIAASGNVNSLLEEDEETAKTMSLTGKNFCYDSIFKNCTSLTQAPELPAMTLANSCYQYMFLNCSSLTEAPALPAETLVSNCYNGMFQGCAALTQAPALPAMTVINGCYANMFRGCTSLTTSPELPATTVAASCYANMFYGCTSLTQVTEKLPATTVAASCYASMFAGCTSLTTSPELPAMTLAAECYSGLFYGCSSLTQAPALPAMILAERCYANMFNGCSSLTTSPELPAMTLAAECYADMFNYCGSLTTAPELPAGTLAEGCYQYMFSNCSSLTQAPELPAMTLANRCYNSMFDGCYSLNYVKVAFTNWDPTNATEYWLPENTGTFTCSLELIINTSDRTTSTVPSSWSMVAA